MTRTLCCPECGSERVWEKEVMNNYAAIEIDDEGNVIETHANEMDFASADPVGMYCAHCLHRTDYKTELETLGLTQNDVRLLWSKIEDE
jgi:hypothetical protein